MKRVVFALLALFGAAPLTDAHALELTSPDLPKNQPMAQTFVYNSYGCAGENISPALSWSDAPPGAKSFALLVIDPDARVARPGFLHWAVVNIPATVNTLPQGAGAADNKKLPAGSEQLETQFGDAAWGGPCPPVGSGVHHYNFMLYALSVEKPELPKNPKVADLVGALEKNALGKASLVSTYSR
jgi:Raf kinase inhibitor-like YbhB/YbcL family protein